MTTTVSRRTFLSTAALATGAALAPKGLGALAPAKPNILLVLVDDLSAEALGFAGHYPFLKTPNIDRLRSEGAHLPNAFVTHSLCSPSRATILTGTYSHIHGVMSNDGTEFNPDRTPHFGQALQAGGYETGFIGKWHMAGKSDPRPGFDTWVSFRGQGNYEGNVLNVNGTPVDSKNYVTDDLNDYAVRFLENRRKDRPFCLYLSHKAVHGPFTPAPRHAQAFAGEPIAAPASWIDDLSTKPTWQRMGGTQGRLRDGRNAPDRIDIEPWPAEGKPGLKNYLRCILAIDEGLGRILQVLRTQGVLDDTLIVFTSDNGYLHGDHHRGDKRVAYDESMRIPMVLRYPRAIPKNSTLEAMVLNLDLAPTFLDAAGLPRPPQYQGQSILSLFTRPDTAWRKSFLFTYWMDLNPVIPRITAVRTAHETFARYPDTRDIDELYDHRTDPHEMVNLATKPEWAPRKKELEDELSRLMAEARYTAAVPDAFPDGGKGPGGLLFSFDFRSSTRTPPADGGPLGLTGKVTGKAALTPGGLVLDGSTRFTLPAHEALNPGRGPVALELVLRPDSDGLFLTYGKKGNGLACFIEDGCPGFTFPAAKSPQYLDGDDLVLGDRVHYFVVIDNPNNFITLYLNGQRVAQQNLMRSLPEDEKNTGFFTLGGDPNKVPLCDLSAMPFRGTIERWALHRAPFTDDQVRERARALDLSYQRRPRPDTAGTLDGYEARDGKLSRGGLGYEWKTQGKGFGRAVRPLPTPCLKSCEIKIKARTLGAEGGNQNVFIAFGDQEGDLQRAGLYLRSGSVAIEKASDRKLGGSRATVDLTPGAGQAFSVGIDLLRRRVQVALGEKVVHEAPLLDSIRKIARVGFGCVEATQATFTIPVVSGF